MELNVFAIVAERVIANITLVSEVVPNLLYGMLLVGVVAYILKKRRDKEPEYFSFDTSGRRKLLFFSFLVGVVLASPLPIRKWSDIIAMLAVGVLVVVLACASYSDRYTCTFYMGYLMVGVSLEVALLVLSLMSRIIILTEWDIMLLLCCVAFNLLLGYIRYSKADMVLFYMCLICFLIVDSWNVVFAFCVCELVSTVTAILIRFSSSVRKILRKEKLMRVRYPFAEYISFGFFVALFLITK